MLNHLYKYLRRRGQFQSKFHFLYIFLLSNLLLQILHYKTTCTQFCITALLFYILIAPHWTVVITSGTWQLNWMENKSMVYTTVRVVISGCCHQPEINDVNAWSIKVTNFQANERYRQCYRNKHLPCIFTFQTHPSEKLVLVFALSGTRTLVFLGRVVRKPVNVKPGLNVNWDIIFSCLKLFFTSNVLCSLRLLQLKTEGQTM